MNLIKKEVMETQLQIAAEAPLQQNPVAASASSSTAKGNMMVGFNEVFHEVLDKLTNDQRNRQIIPIMGMGGIGKTTLAINLFENANAKEHFDIHAWTTISQTYSVLEKLRELYIQASGISRDPSENGKMSDSNENAKLNDVSEIEKLDVNQLGEKLYQFLFGRRYFIIMDDMWGIEVWDKIKFYFPDSKNGSRIIVTTRELDLSSMLNESYRVGMKFLDEASSWALFCKTIFGKESCPLELENTAKNIVANCKGLPLSIATIGGLLSKSEHTSEHWKLIEQNLNSILIDSNDEFCFRILRMSYIYLPNYLKPCFLYMGVFKEDHRIRVSMLMKLWVSCGFLKPRSKKLSITVSYTMHLDFNMMSKVGSLPLLEKLVIKRGIFGTQKWETVEGQFPSLKFLQLEKCWNLQNWIVPNMYCFPLLQKLHLSHLNKLKEIPSEVGEIATLKSICLASDNFEVKVRYD